MFDIEKYKLELSLMAYGYLISFSLWLITYVFKLDSATTVSEVIQYTIWLATASATIGAILLLIKFLKNLDAESK